MSRLTCRDVVEFLSDYLTCELDAAARTAFDEHLAECDECVAYIRGYERTVRLARTAFDKLDEPVEQQVPRQLVDAILAARRR
jgi:anti-sigma factor RsiW